MSHVPPFLIHLKCSKESKGLLWACQGLELLAVLSCESHATPVPLHHTLIRVFFVWSGTMERPFFGQFFLFFFRRQCFFLTFFVGLILVGYFFWTVLSQFCSKLWVGDMISLLFRFLVFCVVSTFLIIFFYFWIFSFCEIDGIWPTLRPPTPPLVSYI